MKLRDLSESDFVCLDESVVSVKSRPEKYRPLTPPFGYFGSKHRLARVIVDMLPPHSAWVEAFCGSASVTLAKPPAQIEILNDIDGQVTNLFFQLRNHPDELCRLIALTPYARAEFELARNPPTAITDLERARLFLIAAMMTVNGTAGTKGTGFSFSDSYTRSSKEARVNRWYNLPERLHDIVDRLRSVRVENKDARVLLREYLDRPATLVYLDPPYLMDREHGYAIDANDEVFHRELLELCCQAHCMILISGYEHSLYSELLTKAKGWGKVEIETKTRATSGRDMDRTEVLWMNRQFQNAKRTNVIPIDFTPKEALEKKVNPQRNQQQLLKKKVEAKKIPTKKPIMKKLSPTKNLGKKKSGTGKS